MFIENPDKVHKYWMPYFNDDDDYMASFSWAIINALTEWSFLGTEKINTITRGAPPRVSFSPDLW